MLPRDGKLLLAASTGGHLAQLVLLADILGVHESSLWVTFDSAQSRSVLRGRRVVHIPYIEPRGYASAARALGPFHRSLRAERFDAALSTGAAIAVPALFAAALQGVPACYVESLSRFDGPSLTGRVLERTPGVRCYTQHRGLVSARWAFDVSVADRLRAAALPAPAGAARPPGRVFVTLGTIRPYRFDALVDNVLAVRPPGTAITWQLGSTPRQDLPGEVHASVTAEEFDRLALDADVVVAHAGTGSALRLVELGVRPLLVPRRSARGEHVDDHQEQLARELARSGLAQVREAGAITLEDLCRPVAPAQRAEPQPTADGRVPSSASSGGRVVPHSPARVLQTTSPVTDTPVHDSDQDQDPAARSSHAARDTTDRGLDRRGAGTDHRERSG